jgi:hypothetical protein
LQKGVDSLRHVNTNTSKQYQYHIEERLHTDQQILGSAVPVQNKHQSDSSTTKGLNNPAIWVCVNA